MKHTIFLLLAALTASALLFSLGCGAIDDEMSTVTTKAPITSTTKTERETASMTTQSSTTETTETVTDDTGLLPDLDDPITDVEPNIPDPDIDTGDGNGIGDIIGDGSMDGSLFDPATMTPNEDIVPPNDGARNNRGVVGRSGRTDPNASNPALPIK